VQADELQSAARIVATQEHRVMLSRGDRAYARGCPAPDHWPNAFGWAPGA